MARSRLSGSKSSLLGILSLGLMAIGVALSGWALANIGGQPSSDTGDVVYVSKVIHVVAGSIAASRTAVAQKVVYPVDPAKGEVFGTLSIPALTRTFPVIQGTDSAELKQGVGHMVQTAMPGEPDNCVISGHRDTVFTDLGRLKMGDRLIVKTARGTFTYQISRIRIVHKDDRTVVVSADHAVLTVSTCYPFRYIGSAPDRYVLVADLVASK
jgi:sortase A